MAFRDDDVNDNRNVSVELSRNENLNNLSPLFSAVNSNDPDAVRNCIADRADINRVILSSNFIPGTTPLLLAAEKGFLEIVEILAEAGANINASNYFGLTALNYATNMGHLEIVNFLISKNADIYIKGYKGADALNGAVINNHIEVVETLINAMDKTKFINEIGAKTLDYATIKGLPDIIEILIKAGVNTNSKCFEYSDSALMTAAYCGNIKLTFVKDKEEIEQLINASTNKYDVETALKIIQILVEAGANVNERNIFGDTALICAIKTGEKEIVELLLKLGADINIVDVFSLSALSYAIEKDDADIVKFLLMHGAELKRDDCINSQDKSPELQKYVKSALYAETLDDFDWEVFNTLKQNTGLKPDQADSRPNFQEALTDLQEHILVFVEEFYNSAPSDLAGEYPEPE